MRALMAKLGLTPRSEDGSSPLICTHGFAAMHNFSRKHHLAIQHCIDESFNRPLRVLVFATSLVQPPGQPTRRTLPGYHFPTEIDIAAGEPTKAGN